MSALVERSSPETPTPQPKETVRPTRVASINTSGHNYGLVYPGVGWIVWRDAAALPDDLILWVNYLRRQHADVRAQLLTARRPGRGAVVQLPPPRLRWLPHGRRRSRSCVTRRRWTRRCRVLHRLDLLHEPATLQFVEAAPDRRRQSKSSAPPSQHQHIPRDGRRPRRRARRVCSLGGRTPSAPPSASSSRVARRRPREGIVGSCRVRARLAGGSPRSLWRARSVSAYRRSVPP